MQGVANNVGIPGVTNTAADDFQEIDIKTMPPSLDRFLDITKDLKNYVLAVTLFLVLSYSVYLIFGEDTVCTLGEEDNVFEYLTAIFFFVASIFFMKKFILERNGWFLLLALVFFIGFGEEISWGQRIFGLSTPALLREINSQNEINLHNIKILNAADNPGIAKFHTIQFLFKLFWLTYGVLLPIAAFHIRSVFSITEKMRLPIPPVPIGIFFLVNWLIFRITLSFLLPPNKEFQYYDTIGEIMECGAAYIFMTLSIYFYNKGTMRLNYNIISDSKD
jgi:hypothetical protein